MILRFCGRPPPRAAAAAATTTAEQRLIIIIKKILTHADATTDGCRLRTDNILLQGGAAR